MGRSGHCKLNSVTVTNILPGAYRSQFHILLLGDGSGELEDYALVDPVADLGISSSNRPVIEMINYSLVGFSARIGFDSGLVAKKMIWVLPEHSDDIDFGAWGGLKDQSGLDGTGKIQITTSGFGDGDQGSVLLMVRNG